MINLHVLQTSTFLRHNAIFFVGSFSAAVLNYLFYPVLGRIMDVADFGETQTLVSLYTQVSVFFAIAAVLVANIVTTYQPTDKEYEVLYELEHLLLLMTALVAVAIVVGAQAIAQYFQFQSVTPLYAFVGALIFNVPLIIRVGYLRGKQQFGNATFSNNAVAGSRLLFSTGLVFAGFKSFGALLGICLSQVAAFLYTAHKAGKAGFKHAFFPRFRFPNLDLLRPQLKYIIFVIAVTFLITLQSSLDLFVVKRLFDPTTAGLYAGISTVAKILFFLTSSISAVLFSSVAVTANNEANRKLLFRSIVLILVIGLPALLVFVLIPQQIVSLLMGIRYTMLTPLLPSLSISIFIVSISNLLLTYAMALRNYSMVLPTVIGAVGTYMLLFFRNDSLEQIVQSMLIGSILLLLLVSTQTMHVAPLLSNKK